MPARATCEKLIAFVRDLVGEAPMPELGSGDDPCATALSDDSIQNALDEHRERIRYGWLEGHATRLVGGTVAYLEFEACGYFDDATQILNSSYTEYAPDAFDDFDALHGRFIFNESQPYSLYLNGNRYDPYRAATAVLTKMAALVKNDVDYKDANTSISASQAAKVMLTLASEYRKHGRVHTIELTRSDT